MSRTKGSKNKPKIAQVAQPPSTAPGNPDFNLNDAEPVDPDWQHPIDKKPIHPPTNEIRAQSAITDEDRALDRELEQMSNENPPLAIDPEPAGVTAKAEKIIDDHLQDHVENYKPASTINEIMSQVSEAKVSGCDSITATLQLSKYYVKDGSLDRVGYFMFHDIKVYVDGHREKAMKRDKLTLFELERQSASGKA